MFEEIYERESKKTNESLLIDEYCSVNYKDLGNIIDNFTNLIKKSRVTLILGSNTINCISIYLACLRLGAIPLLLPQNIKREQLNNFINRFQPYLIYSESRIDLKCSKHIAHQYSNFYIFQSSYKLNSEYPYLLLTTSGSTGNPKVVVVSKDNLDANTKSIINYLKIKDADKHITSLPMNYTYGLSCLNTHLKKKASIILTNKSIMDKNFWEILKKNNHAFH